MSIINRRLGFQWLSQNLSPAGTPANHCCRPNNILTSLTKTKQPCSPERHPQLTSLTKCESESMRLFLFARDFWQQGCFRQKNEVDLAKLFVLTSLFDEG